MKIRILTNEANYMGEKPFMVKTDLELDLKLEICDKLDNTMSEKEFRSQKKNIIKITVSFRYLKN